MPFDILLHIKDDSERGHAIQEMADAQHVTPEQIVEQIIEAGIYAKQAQLFRQPTNGKTPAEMLIGLFSTPEDSALMDEVTDIAYEGRNTITSHA